MDRTVSQRWFLKSPPGKVFNALTTPKMLRRWFLAKAKMEPRKGGSYTFAWHGGYTANGKVLDIVKDKKIVLSWPQYTKEKKILGWTKVSFTIRPKGKNTILSLKHTGYKTGSEKWVQEYALTYSGWSYFLMNLKSMLEHGIDLRDRLTQM